MLKVKKLDTNAKLPTVANPGEDLGYDLYASEPAVLHVGKVTKVRTGISASFDGGTQPFGLLIRDRSSMAARGIAVSAGVVDAGYRGELVVLMTVTGAQTFEMLRAGDKIAQMIPIPVLTGSGVEEVAELPPTKRGTAGFGSSGK